MLQFTLHYKDGHSNEVVVLRDKTYNVFRYANLTKGHICTCFFSDIYSEIPELFLERLASPTSFPDPV